MFECLFLETNDEWTNERTLFLTAYRLYRVSQIDDNFLQMDPQKTIQKEKLN